MDSKQKLKNRPIENDTVILKEVMLEFRDFLGVFEVWQWDGISASTVVLVKSDVNHYSKEELIKTVFEQIQMPVDPKLTYSEKEDYVFINFGFNAED